jgi:acetoacetate decarboxylase
MGPIPFMSHSRTTFWSFVLSFFNLSNEAVKASLEAPNFLLKIIPHVDGSPRICELVRYCSGDVTVKGAWEGPAALELFHHALAPVAALPVLEVLSASHILSDLTLQLGTVVHDYLPPDQRTP